MEMGQVKYYHEVAEKTLRNPHFVKKKKNAK